jgi:asparagine synthase (glutamine-hydrolysing)
VYRGSDFRVLPEHIDAMRDAMVHRGPDGGGTWISADGRVALAHRRLAIIDLNPAAAQPMLSADGDLALVFNGEIYNHAELRRELIALGHKQWKTDHSDTEVIVHAFRQWGIDCLERFRGMFAIALWDNRSRELWLARDRVGVKPLYYSCHHGRIAFASEIKALLRDPAQPRQIDEESLVHYLSFLTSPAPFTLFAGIRKLPGGTWMRVTEDGVIREHRYWDALTHCTPHPERTDDEHAEAVLAELRTAVQLRKVSDVPVGVFLSGGIDSSTNVALFSEGEQRPVQTFTIGYEGENASYANELHYARAIAQRFGAEHHELLLNPSHLTSFLMPMAWLQDEPIADPVCVPLYYVSKLARDNGVVVCQVGEGADELFWGYPGWRDALAAQQLLDSVGSAPLLGGLASLLRHSPIARVRRNGRIEWLERTARGQPVFWGGAEAFLQSSKLRILHPRLRAKAAATSYRAIEPIRQRYLTGAWEQHPLNWMTYLDLNLRLPELLLMRVDKMSMAVSLEGRVPFLDHKLVELAMGIPAAAKTRNGTLKHILKKAVRGIIPDENIDRKKQGFGLPIHEWMLGSLGNFVRDELADFCSRTELLDKKTVLGEFHQRSGADNWRLLNLALWHRTFFQENAGEGPLSIAV